MSSPETTGALWPLAVYAAAVIFVAASMVGLGYILGERHHERETGEPFESGILPTGSARIRLSVKYYMVAMFFVVFDLEAAFILAWAVGARQLGWPGYVEVIVFIVVLLAGLAYLWREGALDWSPRKSRGLKE
jgi:NADH-quinone oxidoreductase subunit A